MSWNNALQENLDQFNFYSKQFILCNSRQNKISHTFISIHFTISIFNNKFNFEAKLQGERVQFTKILNSPSSQQEHK